MGDKPTYQELEKKMDVLKKENDLLKKDKRTIRSLLDATSETAILADAQDFRIVASNKVAADRLRKRVNELVGLCLFDFVPKELAESRKNRGEEVLRSGKPVRFQDTRKSRVYENNIIPVFDDEGKIEALAIYAKDITEILKLERDLRESEERFKTVTEQSPNMIFINTGGRVVYANSRCIEVMGYTRDDFYSPVFDFRCLIAPDTYKKVENNFGLHMQGHEVPPYECGLITKDGQRLDVVLSTKLIQFGGQKSILGIMVDITERKQAEDALKASEQKLRGILDRALQFIGLLSPDGILLEANRTSLEFAGLTESEVIGKPFWETPWWSHSTELQQQLREAIRKAANGMFPKFEANHFSADGERRFIECSLKPVFDDEGKVVFLIPTGHDITERRQAEKTLREARDELEMQFRERTSELLEANTLLKQEVAERNKAQEELERYHEKLRSLASQLSLAEERERRRVAAEVHDHIAQNLAFAKIKLDGLRTSTAPEYSAHLSEIVTLLDTIIQDTRSLVSELGSPILYELGLVPAVQWLAQKAEAQHGIDVQFKDDGHPKPLRNDIQVFLFQAVRELLANVVKHAKASHCTVSLAVRDGFVQVDVVDDGVGFNSRAIGDSDTDGEGFGFFSIRERLEPLGGRLGVFSEQGEGTQVTLFAPLENHSPTAYHQ